MKHQLKPLATALAAAMRLAAVAAVPLSWDVRPGQPAPVMFDRHHGESLEFRCTFRGFGELPFGPDADIRLWYQTNGMGQTWWSAPAAVQSNVLSAVWSPELDPGADRVSLFIGAPSNAYASAVLRLRHSPGFAPAVLSLPVQLLDYDAIAVTNAPYYTKGEADDRIVELSPGNYAAVSNAAMNAAERVRVGTVDYWMVQSEYETYRHILRMVSPTNWVYGPDTDGLSLSLCRHDPEGLWTFKEDHAGESIYTYHPATSYAPASAQTLDFEVRFEFWGATGATGYTLVHSNETQSSSVAYLSDIPPAITNVVTKPYVESLGIESGIQEETDPVWSAEKSNYATKTELATVEGKADAAALDASSALRIVLGESVWFAVTNYMRTAEGVIPSLQLWEVRDSATNLVYDSREEITNMVKVLTGELRTEMTNRIHAVSNTIPSKAWGNYQSDGTDNPQPGEVAILNPPTIILTGGGTFNKYIEVGDSSVWVLQSSGPVSFGGNTNGNFFAVLDDEGNSHFRVAKTDSYDLPVFISDILPRQSQNHILIYTATTNRHGNAVTDHPILSASSDLKSSWHEEVEGEIDALGITVSWAKDETIPAWVATVTPDTYPPKLFFRAKVVQEGGVAVINEAPVRFDGGVQLGNGTYRLVPYTTGGKTYLTVEGLP